MNVLILAALLWLIVIVHALQWLKEIKNEPTRFRDQPDGHIRPYDNTESHHLPAERNVSRPAKGHR